MTTAQWTADGVHGKTGVSARSRAEKESPPERDSAIGRQLREVVPRAPVTTPRRSLAR